MTLSALDIINASTVLKPVPLVPEMTLYQATEEITRNWLTMTDIPTPFWAFPWPGGQALARFLLDNPERVRGKRVLDFASGSGLIGIAAAMAGAIKVYACDIDPTAQVATQLNAARNTVAVENIRSINMDKPFQGVDLIVTGDVCYNQAMTTQIMRWLYYCVAAGIPVLLGDPARAYVPRYGLHEIARYTVPVRRELEDADTRPAMVWEVHLPEEK